MKIEIINNKIISDIKIIDNTLDLTYNSDIEIVYLNSDISLTINVFKNKNINLYEDINNSTINNIYNVSSNSTLILNRFSTLSTIKTIINLNDSDANVLYNYRTINQNDQTYILDIYHNNKNTNSKINNSAINVNNKLLKFYINGYILKESTNCNLIQDSKIITNNTNYSLIMPNLIIDNNDINATHSSYIGEFNNDDLFYLQSRGLTKEASSFILAKALLLDNMKIKEKQKQKIIDYLTSLLEVKNE